MAIDEAKREGDGHLDRQAAVLRRYQYLSLMVAIVSTIALCIGGGLPAMVVFVVSFVYWRDTRNRQQSLENARLSFQSVLGLAHAVNDLTDRIDAIAPRAPQPTAMQSFMQRVNRGGNEASA